MGKPASKPAAAEQQVSGVQQSGKQPFSFARRRIAAARKHGSDIHNRAKLQAVYTRVELFRGAQDRVTARQRRLVDPALYCESFTLLTKAQWRKQKLSNPFASKPKLPAKGRRPLNLMHDSKQRLCAKGQGAHDQAKAGKEDAQRSGQRCSKSALALPLVASGPQHRPR
jgi:hypothetical protein